MTVKTFFAYLLLGVTTLVVANLVMEFIIKAYRKEENQVTDEKE